MKRFCILVAVVVLATSLVAGCGEVKTYTDPGQVISIGVTQEFVIAVTSNPTTGYSWQESYDEAMLELVDKTYQPTRTAEQEVVGSGGVELFRFKALKKGETRITMTYKRPWEEESLGQSVFTVTVK